MYITTTFSSIFDTRDLENTEYKRFLTVFLAFLMHKWTDFISVRLKRSSIFD